MSLARELATAARGVLVEVGDPAEAKKEAIASKIAENATTLSQVTKEWFSKQATRWAAPQSNAVMRSLERDVFPTLGERPIAAIGVTELREVLSEIESLGAGETAHRIRRRLDNVWAYAIATDRAKKNPAEQLNVRIR